MNFRQFLEADDRMRAKISDKPNVYGPGVDENWKRIILGLAGQWVDIDTQHIFGTSLNAINPEGGGVFHLPLNVVQDINNDIRPKMAKCGWCGATFNNIEDKDIGKACPKCDVWPQQDLAVLDRLRPLVTVQNGKPHTIHYAPRKRKTPEGDVWR